MNILDLPLEIIDHIQSFLNVSDWLSCQLVDTTFYSASSKKTRQDRRIEFIIENVAIISGTTCTERTGFTSGFTVETMLALVNNEFICLTIGDSWSRVESCTEVLLPNNQEYIPLLEENLSQFPDIYLVEYIVHVFPILKQYSKLKTNDLKKWIDNGMKKKNYLLEKQYDDYVYPDIYPIQYITYVADRFGTHDLIVKKTVDTVDEAYALSDKYEDSFVRIVPIFNT